MATHSAGQEAVLGERESYNSEKQQQTPKERWKLGVRKKSLACARKAQEKRLYIGESRSKGMA